MEPATVLERVDAIVPKLADLAERCDEARRLAPESMQILLNSGVFRIPQPARTGGYELDLRTLGAAVTKLSRGCAASGWVLMVMGAHHFCMGTFSEDAQDEVFGDGRDGLVAGTLSWQGNAVACDGGYRVNGRWQFCSGVDHSEWVMLGCADPDSHAPRVHVVVRPEEIEIDDTWHVMGLQGTGSQDVVAHDVFVPEHRAIDTRLMFGGRSPFIEGHATNLYRLSPEAMLSMSVSTAVLGSAQYAHDAFIERTKDRRVILTGARKAEHAPTQIRAAEAEGELRAAHLLQQDVYDAFDRLLESGERFDRAHTTWARWRVSHAAALCRRAVERLWSGSGAHGVYRGSALQRAFRNVQVGAQHASLDFDTGAEAYGRGLLQPR